MKNWQYILISKFFVYHHFFLSLHILKEEDNEWCITLQWKWMYTSMWLGQSTVSFFKWTPLTWIIYLFVFLLLEFVLQPRFQNAHTFGASWYEKYKEGELELLSSWKPRSGKTGTTFHFKTPATGLLSFTCKTMVIKPLSQLFWNVLLASK